MNLYRISQSVNEDYDTYDSAIVAAPDEKTARKIHPGAFEGSLRMWVDGSDNKDWTGNYPCWATSPDDVVVELVGTAAHNISIGVVLASFNAG